jgi:hypothetical protein
MRCKYVCVNRQQRGEGGWRMTNIRQETLLQKQMNKEKSAQRHCKHFIYIYIYMIDLDFDTFETESVIVR